MRVLVFSTYFWPEETGPAPYVTEPARYLAGRGHEVEVWTGFAHYPAWSPMQGRALARRERLDGMVVHRRLHYVPRAQSALSRALYEGSLSAGALTALVQARRPDVVLGVTPTLSGALVGAAAARRFGVPFALIVHDLMGKAAEQSGVAGGGRVAAAVRPLELLAARRAQRIGIIAEGFRGYFTDAGIPDERIVRLRTWTLGGAPPEANGSARARLGWDDDFIVLHGGNMGHKQGLTNLIETAAELRGSAGIRIVLAGDGNDRANLERRAADLRLENLQFLGPQPWGEYEAMLAAADVLVVNQRATVGDMSLPSKLTSYFAAGRPTLAAVAPESETAAEVERSGGGVVVPAENPAALATAVRALRDDPDRRVSLGESARRYAAERLAAAAVLPEYERFLSDLCA
ncbi:MAG: colanic acid biosynthesis glycosyl transferase WcaI [Thermoleophilaceae bacterium]|nr:colanic acid biosynthesis glycosyl transferase WcaI [Thermoleophilaceae bacterium]